MEIGDSVLFADAADCNDKRIDKMRRWGHLQDPKRWFMSAKVEDTGVRVWRVANRNQVRRGGGIARSSQAKQSHDAGGASANAGRHCDGPA
jgi:hypothetical protein